MTLGLLADKGQGVCFRFALDEDEDVESLTLITCDGEVKTRTQAAQCARGRTLLRA